MCSKIGVQMDLYKTEFIDSYIDLNKFIGFRGILLYTPEPGYVLTSCIVLPKYNLPVTVCCFMYR